MKTIEKDKYLLISKYLLEQGSDEDIRICSYAIVDYYKQILTDVAKEIRDSNNLTQASIKHKIILLGSRISKIHSINEFNIIEKLRNRISHEDNFIPNRNELKNLLDRAKIIENIMKKKSQEYAEKMTKIKTFEEHYETLCFEKLGELDGWLRELKSYSILKDEIAMLTKRRDEIDKSFLDISMFTVESLNALLDLITAINEAKKLYTDIESYYEDLAADAYAEEARSMYYD